MNVYGTRGDDQILEILLSDEIYAKSLAKQLSFATHRPVPDYNDVPSPHCANGHVCVRLKVQVWDYVAKELLCTGLACFDSESGTISVWLEVALVLVASFIYMSNNLSAWVCLGLLDRM